MTPLTTDTLCCLYCLAVRPPDTCLKYAQIETLLAIDRLGVRPAMQPLIDRQWVTGTAKIGYTLTDAGRSAAQSITTFAFTL